MIQVDDSLQPGVDFIQSCGVELNEKDRMSLFFLMRSYRYVLLAREWFQNHPGESNSEQRIAKATREFAERAVISIRRVLDQYGLAHETDRFIGPRIWINSEEGGN